MNLLSRIGAAATLAAAVSTVGCTTARYNENDLTRINLSSKRMNEISSLASNPSAEYIKGQESTLSYEDTLIALKRYGGALPSQRLNVYLSNNINQGLEEKTLDTTGPLNASMNEVLAIESRMNGASRTRLNMGSPNSNFASSRSSSNQLSNDSGLLGIDIYSGSTSPKFSVEVNETNTIGNNLNETKGYVVKITFGTKATELVKKKTDYIYPIQMTEDATVGFAAFGPAGAAGTTASNLVDGVWAYVEGSSSPKGTTISRNATISNLERTASNTLSTLNFAKSVKASDVLVINYKGANDNNETAVIYAKDATLFRQDGNTATFITSKEGVNHLASFFYRAIKTGAAFGTAHAVHNSTTDHNHDHPEGNSVHGGETGGVGGTINGSEGSGQSGGFGGQ